MNARQDQNRFPTLIGVGGTAGTADAAGTADIVQIGVNQTTGAMYVQDLSGASGTTTVQMVSGTLNVGTVVVSSQTGGTNVNVVTGTITTGSLSNVAVLNAGTVVVPTGTITTGSLTNIAMVHAGTHVHPSGTVTAIVAGTQNTLGTVGVVNNLVTGTLAALTTVTTVSNITNGSVNILTGTLQSSGTTTGVGVVTSVTNLAAGTVTAVNNIVGGTVTALALGTVKVNHTPVGSILVYSNTLGTAGAAFWGTLVAPVGAGTFLYLTSVSIIGHSGTVDCGVANNVAGSTGLGVITRGFVPPGGGVVQPFDPPITTVANGTLTYFLNGAGTVSFNVAYWVSP